MAVLASFFLIYRLIAQNFGPQGVGEYSLIKRAIGIIQPLLLLGLGVGITRYVAISLSPKMKMAFFKVAMAGVIMAAAIFLIAANIFQKEFARLFFGSADFVSLVVPFSFLLGGLLTHSLVYSFFRGMMAYRYFNVLQILNISILPVFIFLFFSGMTIGSAIFSIGILTGFFSFIFFLFYAKEKFLCCDLPRSCWREIFLYSLPRCVGDILYGGLFFLGPVAAVYFGSAVEAGYFSLAQGLLMVLGSLIGPLGLVLLPKISDMIARGKNKEIAAGIDFLFIAVLYGGIFASLQAMIFADVAIKIWLGAEFLSAVPIIQILFFSGVFYSFYAASVSILNASKNKPIDAANLFAAIVFYAVFTGVIIFIAPIFSPIVSLACAFSATMIFLGILSYRSINKIYPRKINRDLLLAVFVLIINFPLAFFSLSIKPFIVENLFFMILYCFVLAAAYSFIFYFLNIGQIKRLLANDNRSED